MSRILRNVLLIPLYQQQWLPVGTAVWDWNAEDGYLLLSNLINDYLGHHLIWTESENSEK